MCIGSIDRMLKQLKTTQDYSSKKCNGVGCLSKISFKPALGGKCDAVVMFAAVHFLVTAFGCKHDLIETLRLRQLYMVLV